MVQAHRQEVKAIEQEYKLRIQFLESQTYQREPTSKKVEEKLSKGFRIPKKLDFSAEKGTSMTEHEQTLSEIKKSFLDVSKIQHVPFKDDSCQNPSMLLDFPQNSIQIASNNQSGFFHKEDNPPKIAQRREESVLDSLKNEAALHKIELTTSPMNNPFKPIELDRKVVPNTMIIKPKPFDKSIFDKISSTANIDEAKNDGNLSSMRRRPKKETLNQSKKSSLSSKIKNRSKSSNRAVFQKKNKPSRPKEAPSQNKNSLATVYGVKKLGEISGLYEPYQRKSRGGWNLKVSHRVTANKENCGQTSTVKNLTRQSSFNRKQDALKSRKRSSKGQKTELLARLPLKMINLKVQNSTSDLEFGGQ